ncbi:MAG: DNA-methyltransferase [Thermoguttaceae bacterium]
MSIEPFNRLDTDIVARERILPFCRLRPGEIWHDTKFGHKVGVLDATRKCDISGLFEKERAVLAIQDPPYNVAVGNENTVNLFKISIGDYLDFSRKWMENNLFILDKNASLYIWLGADQKEHFQPLPDFMILMRNFPEIVSRSFITMRNQRGYGTQKNWMAVRQECLYYTKGQPIFNIEAEYTDIPKILRGYYKEIGGVKMGNLERGKSENIRAGNVWVDIQQVFYRTHENVPGCYAQKPIKAIERIIRASSNVGDIIADFFSHSGTTLIAGDVLKRRVYTCDLDPIFAEITIRRLENFRKTGILGFQYGNPFPEIEEFTLNAASRKEESSIKQQPLQPILF